MVTQPAPNEGAVVVVYSTIGTEADAKDLARRLLEERLIACANLLPLQSLYNWEGRLQDEPEVGLFLKTDRDRLEALMARLPALHPYDVPCLEVFPVEAVHPPYAAWVREETRPTA